MLFLLWPRQVDLLGPVHCVFKEKRSKWERVCTIWLRTAVPVFWAGFSLTSAQVCGAISPWPVARPGERL